MYESFVGLNGKIYVVHLFPWAWIRQTEYNVKLTKEASTKIVNLITPWAGGLNLGLDQLRALFLQKSSSILLDIQVDELSIFTVMTKERSTKIVNFMTLLGAEVHVLGRGLIRHILIMHCFFRNHFLFVVT